MGFAKGMVTRKQQKLLKLLTLKMWLWEEEHSGHHTFPPWQNPTAMTEKVANKQIISYQPGLPGRMP